MPRRRQSHTEPITIDRIVDAALDVVDTEGYEALTMRAVAARLGTGQASLYSHVANKTELRRAVMNRLLEEVAVTAADDPRTRLRSYLDGVAGVLAGHPGIANAYFSSRPDHPAALRLFEGVLEVLADLGLTPAQRVATDLALDTAIIGPLLAADARRRTAADAPHLRDLADSADAFTSQGLPKLAEHARAWADSVPADVEAEVREIFLAGLLARYGVPPGQDGA